MKYLKIFLGISMVVAMAVAPEVGAAQRQMHRSSLPSIPEHPTSVCHLCHEIVSPKEADKAIQLKCGHYYHRDCFYQVETPCRDSSCMAHYMTQELAHVAQKREKLKSAQRTLEKPSLSREQIAQRMLLLGLYMWAKQQKKYPEILFAARALQIGAVLKQFKGMSTGTLLDFGKSFTRALGLYTFLNSAALVGKNMSKGTPLLKDLGHAIPSRGNTVKMLITLYVVRSVLQDL